MFLPFALYDLRHVSLGDLGPGQWLAIAYYGVVVTVLAFLLWARGVARVPASAAAVFTGVLPVSAVTLSYLVLGEPIVASDVLGGVCVLAAIVVVARAR